MNHFNEYEKFEILDNARNFLLNVVPADSNILFSKDMNKPEVHPFKNYEMMKGKKLYECMILDNEKLEFSPSHLKEMLKLEESKSQMNCLDQNLVELCLDQNDQIRLEYFEQLGMMDEPVLQRSLDMNSMLGTFVEEGKENYVRVVLQKLRTINKNVLKANQHFGECLHYFVNEAEDSSMLSLAVDYFVSPTRGAH